jgi:hypothetical protein
MSEESKRDFSGQTMLTCPLQVAHDLAFAPALHPDLLDKC